MAERILALLQEHSMCSNISKAACSRPPKVPAWTNSDLMTPIRDSVTALSRQQPVRPTESLTSLASESGFLSSSIFDDIADAIRGQNGLSVEYEPGDMAAAILALTGDTKPRAVLLDDGTLEFNYVGRARSMTGGTVLQSFEIDQLGYVSAGARPWDSVKTQVKRVVIDPSFSACEADECDYWFSGFTNLVEVRGFENMQQIATGTQLFAGCGSLETIYATSFRNAMAGGSSMFYGCPKLVGGADCFVPTNSTSWTALKLGAGGVLTDPTADAREWCYGHLLQGLS